MINVVLNPDYFLRNDEKRAFIINKYSFNNSADGWSSIIHPIHAMIFSFFTKNESYEITLIKISDFLSMSSTEVEELLTPFIENPEDVYVTLENTQFNIPRNILIKSEKEITYDRTYSPEDFCCVDYDFTTKRYLKAPLNMTFMPNNNCLTDCIYCYADKNHKIDMNISFDRLIEILDEAKKLSVLSFNVVGGEVFTYPNWRRLLKEIKKRHFDIMRLSTKVPISLDDIKFLKSIGIHEIQVSLDSLIENEIKLIVKANKTYIKKIQDSLQNLKNEEFNIQIATVLTKHNASIESIDSIFEFINRIKVNSWSIVPGMESLYKPEQSFRAKKDALFVLFDYVDSLKNNCSIKISIDKTFVERNYGKFEGGSTSFTGASCSALCSHIFILPDGKVTMCEQLYWNPHFLIGNLSYQTITEVWNSDRAMWFLRLKPEILQSTSPCSTCEIFEKCYNNMNRCWTEVIKAYGNENWDYPDPRCSLAPKMINNLEF